MSSVILPLITCLVGAAFGFLATRLNDWIVERRELRRAGRHLRTEAANVVRHYTMMHDRLAAHETEVAWRNAVNLETCRFYGNGLGTFDISTLRLFDSAMTDEAMYLMLMIRNNNSYVDQAKAYLTSGDMIQFHDVCKELLERCNMTIDRAEQIENIFISEARGVTRLF